MGAFWSSLVAEQDPDLDVVDPVTSLTPRDRKHVADTWRTMHENVRENGVALFANYFEAYPEAQAMFPAFRGVPLGELRTRKTLLAHTNNVMYTLTCVVDNLDDPECLAEMLSKVGENHARRHITQQHFQDLKGILLALLKEKLGPAMTPAVQTSWEKTIDMLYKGIFVGLDRGA